MKKTLIAALLAIASTAHSAETVQQAEVNTSANGILPSLHHRILAPNLPRDPNTPVLNYHLSITKGALWWKEKLVDVGVETTGNQEIPFFNTQEVAYVKDCFLGEEEGKVMALLQPNTIKTGVIAAIRPSRIQKDLAIMEVNFMQGELSDTELVNLNGCHIQLPRVEGISSQMFLAVPVGGEGVKMSIKNYDIRLRIDRISTLVEAQKEKEAATQPSKQ